MVRSSRAVPYRIYALKIPLPVMKIPFFSAMDMCDNAVRLSGRTGPMIYGKAAERE
jgi:hypothetical protein